MAGTIAAPAPAWAGAQPGPCATSALGLGLRGLPSSTRYFSNLDMQRAVPGASHQRVYSAARATLRLHGLFDPQHVTKALLLPPDRFHSKDDVIVSRSTKGRILVQGTRTAAHWSMSSREWVTSWRLATHVSWVLDQLVGKESLLAELLADPLIHADIFCYSAGRTSTPPSLPGELRGRAQALGLDIDIDHYDLSQPTRP